MDVMGWTVTGMAMSHQHVTDPVRADIAKKVGGLIEARTTETEPPSGGPNRPVVRRR